MSDTNDREAEHGRLQAQRLLEELYRQRTELGEIAGELISLLQAAGINRIPDRTPDRDGGGSSSD